jgi:hypothetical protein
MKAVVVVATINLRSSKCRSGLLHSRWICTLLLDNEPFWRKLLAVGWVLILSYYFFLQHESVVVKYTVY